MNIKSRIMTVLAVVFFVFVFAASENEGLCRLLPYPVAAAEATVCDEHNFSAENTDERYLKASATCTEKAVYFKSCINCGLSSEGTVQEALFYYGEPIGHSWGEWKSDGGGRHTRSCVNDSSHTETAACISGGIEVVPPTCTEEGYSVSVCEICGGESKTGIIPPTGHNTVKIEKKYPSYIAVGNIEYYECTLCKKVFTDEAAELETTVEAVTIPMLERSYTPGDPDNDGKITANDARLALRCSVGLENFDSSDDRFKACDIDADYRVTSGDARMILRGSVNLENITGKIHYHIYDGEGTSVAATCTECGTFTGYCLICGSDVTVITDPPAGHSWDGGTVTREAGCTENGEIKYVCTVCNAEKTETTDALGHDWTEAVCTAPKTCTRCGKTEGEALGHSWNEGQVTKEASCVEEGIKTYTCLRCGETKTEALSALGHEWEKATCTVPKTCTRCGNTEGKALGHLWKNADCTSPKTCTRCKATEGGALGHSWDEGRVVKAPAYGEPGKKQYKCNRCRATKDETLAAIEYRFVNAEDLYQVRTVIPAENPDALITEGSEGLRVRWIIRRLGLGNGIGMGGAIYNRNVMAAVKSFQKNHSLTADGIAGILTWKAMGFTESEWNICGAYHSPVKAKKSSTKEELIEIMIDRAEDYLGSPYVIGASGPPGEKYGIDCSGLVIQALYAAGIDMKTITPVTHARPGHEFESRNIWNYGKFRRVSYSDRRRGDLIVYQNRYGTVQHIAIYLGNNKIIESWPNVVQISPIVDGRHGNVRGVLRVFE